MIKKLILTALIVLGLAYTLFTNVSALSNDLCAYETLLQIQRGETIFQQRNRRYGTMDELAQAGLHTTPHDGGVSHGYRFELRVSDSSYTVSARPLRKSFHGYWGTGTDVWCRDELLRDCGSTQSKQ